MTRNAVAAPPRPVALNDLSSIQAAARGLYAGPLSGAERLAAIRVLAALLPDEDPAPLRGDLEKLYPTLRATRDRLKALQLAVELLAPDARPTSFGEQVLHEMAADDE